MICLLLLQNYTLLSSLFIPYQMSLIHNNLEPVNLKMVQQFAALFDYATIGIIITGTDGVIINFNHYAERQFGYTKNEFAEQI